MGQSVEREREVLLLRVHRHQEVQEEEGEAL